MAAPGRLRSRHRGAGAEIIDKRVAGIACAFFTLFAVLQTVGALLAPSPAGTGVLIPFVVYCAEIFLAVALGIAYVVNLAVPATVNRAVLAGSLWAGWIVMGAGVWLGVPRLAMLLDRYEYGASLGTISAAPGMTAAQIARGSTLEPSFAHSNTKYDYAAAPGRIFTFAAAGTPAAFDHASFFEASMERGGAVRAIHVTIVPGTPDANASAAALERAGTLLRSGGWTATRGAGGFARGNLRIHLVRKIVGHTNIDDPDSPAEYSVSAELTAA